MLTGDWLEPVRQVLKLADSLCQTSGPLLGKYPNWACSARLAKWVLCEQLAWQVIARAAMHERIAIMLQNERSESRRGKRMYDSFMVPEKRTLIRGKELDHYDASICGVWQHDIPSASYKSTGSNYILSTRFTFFRPKRLNEAPQEV